MKTTMGAQSQIHSLQQSLMEAQISFDLWEGLREARCSQNTVDVMQPYAGFFTGIEHALFNSFVVLLYAIYENRKDTVSINALLRTLSSSLSNEKKSKFDARAKAVKPIWIKVGILRNEVVGHQALDLGAEDSFSKAKISPEELREFITSSQRLIGDISSETFGNALMFNVKSKPYLNSLLNDLPAAN
jgi:AbiU2